MRSENAGLAPGEREAVQERCGEIEQQQAAHEIAAGEGGNDERAGFDVDDERSEVPFLHGPDPQVHLVERGDEDQHHGEPEQREGELEGNEGIAQRAEQVSHGVFPSV